MPLFPYYLLSRLQHHPYVCRVVSPSQSWRKIQVGCGLSVSMLKGVKGSLSTGDERNDKGGERKFVLA